MSIIALGGCDGVYSASGVVLSPDLAPVPNAVVTLELRGRAESTVTSKDGSFDLYFIDSGMPLLPSPKLRVYRFGYREWLRKVSKDPSRNKELEVTLTPDSGLGPVVQP